VRFTPGKEGVEAAAFQGEFVSGNKAEGIGVFQYPNNTKVESAWRDGANAECERLEKVKERAGERQSSPARGPREAPVRRGTVRSKDKGMTGISAASFKINNEVLVDSSQGSIRLRRKAKAEDAARCLDVEAAQSR